MRLPRLRLRTLMVAVAAGAVATWLAVEWSGFRQQRATSLAWARLYREYEARVRFEADRHESCSAKHSTADQRSCQPCRLRWDYMRTHDGVVIRSPAQAAAALRQAAELFARMAERNERKASAPWSRPSPMTRAELDAWRVLQSGYGPVSEKFFTVL